MNQLRTAASALLDKVAALLQGEPVRLIGYSAAAVIYGAIYGLNAMGITRFGENLSFETALTLSLASIGVLTLIIERLRMFVYAPQTYIEDLSDAVLNAVKQGHIEAHAEEEFRKAMEEAIEQVKAKRTRVPVGSVKAAGSKDASN